MNEILLETRVITDPFRFGPELLQFFELPHSVINQDVEIRRVSRCYSPDRNLSTVCLEYGVKRTYRWMHAYCLMEDLQQLYSLLFC